MRKQYGLFAGFIILVGVNIFLYMTWRQRINTQSKAWEMLAGSMEPYEFREENTYRLRGIKNMWGVNLYSAAQAFATEIDSLQASYTHPPEMDRASRDYFEKSIAINQKRQAKLWAAAKQFNQAMQEYLETDVAKARNELKVMHEVAREQFELMEQKANHSTAGRHSAEFEFRLVKDTIFRLNLQWTKKTDTVIWHYYDDNYHHNNYLTRLTDKINSTQAFQTQALLNKMISAFRQPGHLSVYNHTYDLTDIMPAELASACQYLVWLKSEMEKSYLLTYRDAQFF
jgi:hypothetical protein